MLAILPHFGKRATSKKQIFSLLASCYEIFDWKRPIFFMIQHMVAMYDMILVSTVTHEKWLAVLSLSLSLSSVLLCLVPLVTRHEPNLPNNRSPVL